MCHTPAENRHGPSGRGRIGQQKKCAGRQDLEVLVFAVFNGLLYGTLLFMLSSGLTLIFSMMGVLNFAHASFFMLGAYIAYTIAQIVGFWPALLIAPLLVGAVGALVQHHGLR